MEAGQDGYPHKGGPYSNGWQCFKAHFPEGYSGPWPHADWLSKDSPPCSRCKEALEQRVEWKSLPTLMREFIEDNRSWGVFPRQRLALEQLAALIPEEPHIDVARSKRFRDDEGGD
jgi:hypothetical protein